MLQNSPARPTICQVLHGMHVGGAEILAARLARQLAPRYDFVFACLDFEGSLGAALRADGFPVHVLDRRDGLDLGCVRRLARLVDHERIDLLHAHQYTPFFYASIARRLVRRRTPVFFTEHGRHHPDYPRRKRMLANRFLLGRHDRVIGVGEAVRQALICNEGFAPDHVGVIYNGVPLERFENLSPSLASATRTALGLAPDDLVLIQVARLDYLKDHATALRMMRAVINEQPAAHLLLVGDGPERVAIETLRAELGLGSNVHLLGQRDDIPALLAASDIVLLTSISEGIPLTLIEAMAAARPIVATQVGGVAEVVPPGKTGLLATAGDPEALARHVLTLAHDHDYARRLGELGRARAHAVFSESQMHERYVELIERMLGQSPRPERAGLLPRSTQPPLEVTRAKRA